MKSWRLFRAGAWALAGALSLTLALAPTSACAPVTNLIRPAGPVQAVVMATEATDAANQLGELVLQMQLAAHKLHLQRVIPVETDNAVQTAAIAFANAKDAAVIAFARAQSAAQITAAAAPLVGHASTIVTMLSTVRRNTLTGTAGLLTAQLPPTLDRARELMKQLGGPS